MKKIIFLIITLSFIGCSWPHPPASPGTLYFRLGGAEGTQRLVDRFMVEVLLEPRLNTSFIPLASDKVKLHAFKHAMYEYICAQAEGGCITPDTNQHLSNQRIHLRVDQLTIFLEKFSSILYDSSLTGIDREFISTRTTPWLTSLIEVP
jgi:hypothetical protein